MYNSITVFANAKPTNFPVLRFKTQDEYYTKISELLNAGHNRTTNPNKGNGYFESNDNWLTITLLF